MIMGTAISLTVTDPPADIEAAADAAFQWFRDVDARYSTYRADSEVSRIRRGEVPLARASAEMRRVLAACERFRVRSDGFFDVYAAGELDPSAYVKGWSVQVASDRLRSGGAINHCLNAGGDVRVRGLGPAGPWRIGVRHPWQAERVAFVVGGTDVAVATSGRYERGDHVIDPIRRAPATDLASVTVTGTDLGVADAYATAALAMGTAGIDWLATLRDYESAVITSAGQAYVSTGFPLLETVEKAEQ
jgi:thiamine biosynthesis lipoprotein